MRPISREDARGCVIIMIWYKYANEAYKLGRYCRIILINEFIFNISVEKTGFAGADVANHYYFDLEITRDNMRIRSHRQRMISSILFLLFYDIFGA